MSSRLVQVGGKTIDMGGQAVSRAVLLVNLGTPRSPSVADVRRYLNEFLMDPYVLTAPWPVRRFIVSGFILPFRPRRSAAAYASIWTEQGSPLLHHTQRLAEAVGEQTGLNCLAAMRYGEPSIAEAIARLQALGCTEVLLAPLFPQHADSTRTTAIAAVRKRLPTGMQLQVLPPFYGHENYVDCQVRLLERHLPADWDHLLLSYHGLPEQHLLKADPTGNHCLAKEDCCERASPAHVTCYRHQCYETARALAVRLGAAIVGAGESSSLARGQLSVSFQSRLGRLPWLRPYTDQVLAELPSRGVRRLAVYCPSFVADNLETLEEIGIQGRETFLQAGGESLTLIPCLNAAPEWVRTLAGLLQSCRPNPAKAICATKKKDSKDSILQYER